MLSGPSASADVFTCDNDPDFVGDALPFAIKIYEIAPGLAPRPRRAAAAHRQPVHHVRQRLRADPGRHDAAGEAEKKEFLLARAKNLYLRGRDIIFVCLEKKYPAPPPAAARTGNTRRPWRPSRKDAPRCSTGPALGWLGGFAIDPFDMDLGADLPAAAALIERVDGARARLRRRRPPRILHPLLRIAPRIHGRRPGKGPRALRQGPGHFRGQSDTPYLSLATTVCVKEQNARRVQGASGQGPGHRPGQPSRKTAWSTS